MIGCASISRVIIDDRRARAAAAAAPLQTCSIARELSVSYVVVVVIFVVMRRKSCLADSLLWGGFPRPSLPPSLSLPHYEASSL